MYFVTLFEIFPELFIYISMFGFTELYLENASKTFKFIFYFISFILGTLLVSKLKKIDK